MCILCAPLARRAFCVAVPAMLMAPVPVSAGLVERRLVEPRLRLAPSTGRTVALTLDACPGKFDHRIADLLIARQIPATIFVSGTWMRWNHGAFSLLRSRPDLFRLENHGAKHLPAVLGDTAVFGIPPAGTLPAISHEVLQGGATIALATGRAPQWYRGAAGLYSPEAIPLIKTLQFQIAGYSLNSDEGASLPADAVAARIIAARDGDVIVGHINQPGRASGAGIAAGIAALHDAGTRFAHLD